MRGDEREECKGSVSYHGVTIDILCICIVYYSGQDKS